MHKRLIAAAICWTVVAALAIARTLGGAQDFTVWGLVLGLVATIVTGSMLAEEIAERMLKKALRDNEAREDRMVQRVATRIVEILREDRVTHLR